MPMPPPCAVRGLALAALLILSGPIAATEAPAPQLLAEGVEWLPGRFVAGEQPDGNSVIVDAPEGVIVFDAGRHRAHTQALQEAIAARTPARLGLINSHWHLDHSGGFSALRRAFPQAELYASAAIDRARDGFLADYRQQLRELLAAPQPGAPPAKVLGEELDLIDNLDGARPEHVVAATGVVTILGRPLVLGLAQGVSGGDVWLFDPASGVLASGDLVTLPVPLFDTACASRWRADLAALGEQPFATLLPGHGRPLTHAEFDRWRGAFDALLACANGDDPSAKCRDDWLQAVTPLIDDGQRGQGAHLLDYYLKGLRDPARAQRYCASH